MSNAESEVSLPRLYVLRAYCLLLVIAGAFIVLRLLFGQEAMARGVFLGRCCWNSRRRLV